MLDFDEKFKKAENYFKKGDYKKLEVYFAKILTKTHNIKLWELYLTYIKTVNKEALELAYSYTIQNLWFHYDIYQILVDYIEILEDVEKIREVYSIGLANPIHNIGLLYKNYELFEISLNKVTAKTLINEKLPIFQSSFKLYQRLLPYLNNEFDSIDKILSLETEERKEKVLEYFIEKYSYREDLYFVYCEFLNQKPGCELTEDNKLGLKIKDSLLSGIEITNSIFLKCYYSLLFKQTDQLELTNEPSLICYLNIQAQKGEKELFSAINENFTENEQKINALDYAAKLFYSTTLNKEKTLEIYKKGVPLINDKMLDFFLSIFDLQTARIIFKNYKISSEEKRKMAFSEFCLGSLENIRKCFDKENLYKEFRSLVVEENEKVFEKVPCLKEGSVFMRLSSKDAVKLLEKIQVNL
ncbi:hypothetical protein TUBRATIS_25600 [Tubulinosema ratisbonensis]|uniref:Suppressor of forked domain-containing protein n=1 Tax=Tubulinosema ratisbonensis TaxID=291195 RepID=A0A437AIJ0_9MICR|nr:hypothetical protein TUBRATIS_25600 [Tubulinosema ratisbonensis]